MKTDGILHVVLCRVYNCPLFMLCSNNIDYFLHCRYETCRVLDVFPIKPLPDAGMNGHMNGEASSDEEEDDDKPLSKYVLMSAYIG